MNNDNLSPRDRELTDRPQPDWSRHNQHVDRLAFLLVSGIMSALVIWVGVSLMDLLKVTNLNTYKIDMIKQQTDSVPALADQTNLLALQVRVIQDQIIDLEHRQALDDIDRAKRGER